MRSRDVDHLVVTAPRLADGTAWVDSILGVSPQAGGEHVRMGTHNALLRLGESLYLEVIAPDPAIRPPSRPRWFELDRLAPNTLPRLAAWVARTDDIKSAVRDCGHAFGHVEEMSRGPLKWLITIPTDGSLPGGGAIPMLIEWKADHHPATGLEDQGCTLARLEILSAERHSISELVGCLDLRDAVAIRDLPAGSSPYLVAEIETPGGRRTLSGRR